MISCCLIGCIIGTGAAIPVSSLVSISHNLTFESDEPVMSSVPCAARAEMDFSCACFTHVDFH